MSNTGNCTFNGNCTILDGATTNGTIWVVGYDAHAHVPYWHQRLELAVICLFNSLSLIVIVGRVWYRWIILNRFRGDDRWMAAAAVILIGYTASQIGTNKAGSGLHMDNVHKPWLEEHWHFEMGWVGYYIITSIIKMSVCLTFVELLPHHLTALRYSVFGLATVIASLGITMTFSWFFDCIPVPSNFVWSINSTSCVNFDIFRWMWIGLSLPIDLLLLAVPFKILKRTPIKQHERKVLRLMFSATLLGTITCALGIYGVYETRTSQQIDGFYNETAFIMLNDIEIFMYALGASFPVVLSRHLISRSDPSRSTTRSDFSSWARHVPDLFLPVAALTKSLRDPAPATWNLDSRSCLQSVHRREGDDASYPRDHEPKLEAPRVATLPASKIGDIDGESFQTA